MNPDGRDSAPPGRTGATDQDVAHRLISVVRAREQALSAE